MKAGLVDRLAWLTGWLAGWLTDWPGWRCFIPALVVYGLAASSSCRQEAEVVWLPSL